MTSEIVCQTLLLLHEKREYSPDVRHLLEKEVIMSKDLDSQQRQQLKKLITRYFDNREVERGVLLAGIAQILID